MAFISGGKSKAVDSDGSAWGVAGTMVREASPGCRDENSDTS